MEVISGVQDPQLEMQPLIVGDVRGCFYLLETKV